MCAVHTVCRQLKQDELCFLSLSMLHSQLVSCKSCGLGWAISGQHTRKYHRLSIKVFKNLKKTKNIACSSQPFTFFFSVFLSNKWWVFEREKGKDRVHAFNQELLHHQSTLLHTGTCIHLHAWTRACVRGTCNALGGCHTQMQLRGVISTIQEGVIKLISL